MESETDFSEGSRIVLRLIEQRVTRLAALKMSKAYQLTSEIWAMKLLNVQSVDKFFELGIDREKVQICDGKVKFLRNKMQ